MVEIQVANQVLARDLKMAVQHRVGGLGNSGTACSFPHKADPDVCVRNEWGENAFFSPPFLSFFSF